MPDTTNPGIELQALQAERMQIQKQLTQHYASLRNPALPEDLRQQVEQQIAALDARSDFLRQREETLMAQLDQLVRQANEKRRLTYQRAANLRERILDHLKHGQIDESMASERLRQIEAIRDRIDQRIMAPWEGMDFSRLQEWRKARLLAQRSPDLKGRIIREATDSVLEEVQRLYDRRRDILARAGQLVDLQRQVDQLIRGLSPQAEIPERQVREQAQWLANQATRLGVRISPVPLTPTTQDLRTYLYGLRASLSGQASEAFGQTKKLAIQTEDLMTKRQERFDSEGARAEEIQAQKDAEVLENTRGALGDTLTEELDIQREMSGRATRARLEDAALQAGIPLDRLNHPRELTSEELQRLRAHLRGASPTEMLTMVQALSERSPEAPGELWQSRIGRYARVQGFGGQVFRIVGVDDKGVVVEPWTIAPERTRVTLDLSDADLRRFFERVQASLDPLALPRLTPIQEPAQVGTDLVQTTWWQQLLDEGEARYKEVRPVWRRSIQESLGGIKIPEPLLRYIESETSWVLGNVNDLEDAAQSVVAAMLELAAEQGIRASSPQELIQTLSKQRQGLLARYFQEVMRRQGAGSRLSRGEQAISRLTQQLVADPRWRNKSTQELETEVARRVQWIRDYLAQEAPEKAGRIRERLGYLSGILDVTPADVHTYFRQGFAEQVVREYASGGLWESEPGHVQAVSLQDLSEELERVNEELERATEEAGPARPIGVSASEMALMGDQASRKTLDEVGIAARDVRKIFERELRAGRIHRDPRTGRITFRAGAVSPDDLRAFINAGLTAEVHEIDKHGNLLRTFTPEIPRGEDPSYRKPLIVLRSGEWSAVMGEKPEPITIPVEAAGQTIFLSTGPAKPVLPESAQREVPFYWDVPVGSRAEYIAPGAPLTPTDIHTTQYYLQRLREGARGVVLDIETTGLPENVASGTLPKEAFQILEYSTQEMAGLTPGEVRQVYVRPSRATREYYESLMAKGANRLTGEEVELLRNVAKYANPSWGTAELTPQAMQQLIQDTQQGLTFLESQGKPLLEAMQELQDSLDDTIAIVQNAGFDLAVLRDLENQPLGRLEAGVFQAQQAQRQIRSKLRRVQADIRRLKSSSLSQRGQKQLRKLQQQARELRAARQVARDIERGHFTYDDLLSALDAIRNGQEIPANLPEYLRTDYRWPLVDLDRKYVRQVLDPQRSGTLGRVLARERARRALPAERMRELRAKQLLQQRRTPEAEARFATAAQRREALEQVVQGVRRLPEDLQPHPAGVVEVLHIGTLMGSGEHRSLAEMVQALPGHEEIKAAYAAGAHLSSVDVPATAAVVSEAARMIPVSSQEVRPGQMVGLVGQIQRAGQRGAYTIEEMGPTPNGGYRLVLAPFRSNLSPETRVVDRPIELYFASHQELSRAISHNLIPLADEAAAKEFEASLAADELRRRVQRATTSAEAFRRSLEFVDLAEEGRTLETIGEEPLDKAIDRVLSGKATGRMHAQLVGLQGRNFRELTAYEQFLVRNGPTIEWWYEQQRETLHRLLGQRPERAAWVDARLRELLRSPEGQVWYEFLSAVENLQAANLITMAEAKGLQKSGQEILERYLPETISPYRKRVGELAQGIFLDVDIRTQERAERSILRSTRQVMRRLQQLQPDLTYEERRGQAQAALQVRARELGVESGNLSELARVIRDRADEFAGVPERNYTVSVFAGLAPEEASARMTEIRGQFADILNVTLAGPEERKADFAHEVTANYITTGRLSPERATSGDAVALLRLQRAQELAEATGGAEAGGGIRFFPHYEGAPQLIVADHPAPAARRVTFPGEESALYTAAELRQRLDDVREQILGLTEERRHVGRSRRLEIEQQLEALRNLRHVVLEELEDRAQISPSVTHPLAEQAREALGWATHLPPEQTMIVHGRGQGMTLGEYVDVIDYPDYDQARRALVRRERLEDLMERAEAYPGTFSNRVQRFLRTLPAEELADLQEAKAARQATRLGTATASPEEIERAVNAYHEAFGIHDWLHSQALAEGLTPEERQAYRELAGERMEATPSLELAMVRHRLMEQYELFSGEAGVARQVEVEAKTATGDLFDLARRDRLQEQVQAKTALPERYFATVQAELDRRGQLLSQSGQGLEAARRLRRGITEQLRFFDDMVIQGESAEWLRHAVTEGISPEVATVAQAEEVARRLVAITDVVEGRLSPELAGFETAWGKLSSLSTEQIAQLKTTAQTIRDFTASVAQIAQAHPRVEQVAEEAGETLGERVRRAATRAGESASQMAQAMGREVTDSALGRDFRQAAGIPGWAKLLALGVGGLYVGRAIWELHHSNESNDLLSPDRKEPERVTLPPQPTRSAYVENRQEGLSIQIRGRVKHRPPQDLNRLVSNSIDQTVGSGDVYIRHTDDRQSLTNAWIQSLIAEATR